MTTAVEINLELAGRLRQRFDGVRQADFLACGPELGRFDRILMNPPFANAQDVRHVLHARAMLAPGGLLVGICAGGPRQERELRPLVEACGGLWEDLPPDTFAGTSVRAVLLTLSCPK